MPSNSIQLFGGGGGGDWDFSSLGMHNFLHPPAPLLLRPNKIFSDTHARTMCTGGYAPVF